MGESGDEQFSVGEQSDDIRKALWRGDFKECPMCKSPNIAQHFWSCGCRRNGDSKHHQVA
ncbi:unnamed protein product, partial [Didymodactylos carnosus]